MKNKHETLPMYKEPIRIQSFIDHNSGRDIHWHEEIEILYFTRGKGTVSCNLRDIEVKAGDIIFVNGNELHAGCFNGTNTLCYCIQINTEFFHNMLGKEYVVFENVISDERCAELLDSIISLSKLEGFTNIIEAKRNLFEFLMLVAKDHVSAVLSEDAYKKHFRRLDTFNSIIEFIEMNYDQPLTVKEIADRFFISPSYFAHFFKERTGRSVIDYINHVRIERAKGILRIEDADIGEVACRVGFSDINYFSRKFRMLEGITPSQYKKQHIGRNSDI